MIKISNLTTPITVSDEGLKPFILSSLRTSADNFIRYEIIKKSLDARKKDSLKYVYTLGVTLKNEKPFATNAKFGTYVPTAKNIADLEIPRREDISDVAIVGAGPCGLFCALTLVEAGIKPIIIERGYTVEERTKAIDSFIKSGILNTECNIQFGEGGAGTFSDGKLNTGTKSPYISAVLGEFAKFSGLLELNYIAKPHIGTDVLRQTIIKIREHLISNGAQFLFATKFESFKQTDGKITSIVLSGRHSGVLNVSRLVLSMGHSARDTFSMLYDSGVLMEQKAFSIGVRIEHPQSLIDKSQYGSDKLGLPSADYKLATHLNNGRGVYTFCMCPGGEVVCGSSEENTVVTNGMSYHARDGKNANSALLVSVNCSDFDSEHPLSGVQFQRTYEKKAFDISHSYKAPCQLLGDLQRGITSSKFGEVLPSYQNGTVFADLHDCLPKFAVDGICEGATLMSRKLRGFDSGDSLLTGVETRSSSPVRILRGDDMQSNIKGIYPSGEGCGYAGGITSAGVDGIKTAMAIINSK